LSAATVAQQCKRAWGNVTVFREITSKKVSHSCLADSRGVGKVGSRTVTVKRRSHRLYLTFSTASPGPMAVIAQRRKEMEAIRWGPGGVNVNPSSRETEPGLCMACSPAKLSAPSPQPASVLDYNTTPYRLLRSTTQHVKSRPLPRPLAPASASALESTLKFRSSEDIPGFLHFSISPEPRMRGSTANQRQDICKLASELPFRA
jgi:hypothetical protein